MGTTLEQHTVTKIIEWDAGHRVPNHKSKCRNPHGHRYRLEVTVGGPLLSEQGSSDEGMVYDFGDLKKVIQTRTHDVLDHGFILYDKDNEMLQAFAALRDHYRIVVVPFIPTAENLSKWCYKQISPDLPKGMVLENVRLFETPNSWADYKVTR